MEKLVNGLIVSVVPILLVGIGTIVVQVFDIKECMARMEERLKNHIQYHSYMPHHSTARPNIQYP